MKYRVIADLYHENRDYRPGDEIAFDSDSDSLAKWLISQGTIEEIQPEEAKSSSKKSTPTPS